MRPIPKEMREQMGNDKYYKVCCIKDSTCSGRIEFHHVWIYAAKQINEIWAIVPVCHSHHDRVTKEVEIKEKLEAVSLARTKKDDLLLYPKKNWEQIINYLKSKNLWPTFSVS